MEDVAAWLLPTFHCFLKSAVSKSGQTLEYTLESGKLLGRTVIEKVTLNIHVSGISIGKVTLDAVFPNQMKYCGEVRYEGVLPGEDKQTLLWYAPELRLSLGLSPVYERGDKRKDVPFP